MVGIIELIAISLSTLAFILVPLILVIIVISNKAGKPILFGMLCFLLYGIVAKNLILYGLSLFNSIQNIFISNTLLYSLLIAFVTAILHVLIRMVINSKRLIKDVYAFSLGETTMQCIYIGIPAVVLNLVYALMINLGGLRFVGITKDLIPVATVLINSDYTVYLPYILYPFWVLALNWLTLILFMKKNRSGTIMVSFLVETIAVFVYSYLMLEKLYEMNTLYMFILSVIALTVFLFMRKKERNSQIPIG